MELKLDMDGCKMNCKGCRNNSTKKLSTFDWLCDLPETAADTDYVEVQFKNTRKGYFINSTKIPLKKGDMVAVESSPGHDIGEVTLMGRLALLQMKKNNVNFERMENRRIYRKAKEADFEKYNEAKAKEQNTMIKSRQIADKMNLDMKIGDVEYQGDGNKAIFYYIADERVDFRQLIKVFAETFKVRIEMKQIGARQEAGRIGGIGPCGRELCCSGWMNNFCSVSTSAARYQDISLNPQKLAGQCAKLKCCMNFELDTYVDALKDFPSKEIQLETKEATYYHYKTDVFKGLISYTTTPNLPINLVTLSVERVKEIIAMNKDGKRPYFLEIEPPQHLQENTKKADFESIDNNDLTRFDKRKRKPKKKEPQNNKLENSKLENNNHHNRNYNNENNRSTAKKPSSKKKNNKRPDEK
ncbi:MAG: hypothetical protein LBH80_06625 [Prevotellaceae bacterium]|jgi:cell fate regulator YaaT (PSP1 superfamily)|nr:hypothetical protein [Prevotellaceae bacterium]